MANIQHASIPEAQLHEPKGVSIAPAGSVYVADGAGSGSWAFANAENEVIVNSITDFPTAAAGVITLLANTRYVVAKTLSTSSRFVLSSNTQITSFNILSPVFEYTGTGAMFTSVDNPSLVQDIRLNCPNGEVFNYSDPSGNSSISLIKDVFINSCTKFGTFDSLTSLILTDTSCFNATQGITMIGSGWRVWRLQDIGMLSSNAAFIGIDMGTASCAGILLETSLWGMVAGGIAGAPLEALNVMPGLGVLSHAGATLAGGVVGGVGAAVGSMFNDRKRSMLFDGESYDKEMNAITTVDDCGIYVFSYCEISRIGTRFCECS